LSTPRPSLQRGFTLLEVVVALGILAVGLLVLVDTQSTAVFMTQDMDRTQTATMLANEKMHEVVLTLEAEGWTSQDIEEEGEFEEFGDEDWRGEGLDLDADEDLEGYRWAYTARAIELTLPGDIWGAAGDMADNGYWGDQSESDNDSNPADLGDSFDLSALGVTPDMITEYLSDYIREVRVIVWWGDNEDETDQVELVHHVINISGVVTQADEDE